MTTPSGPGSFIVRLLTADGATAGVGTLVSQSEVLTCAHVVNIALGRPSDGQDRPRQNDVFTVCFPLIGQDPPQTYNARVADWLPPPARRTAGDDLARVLLLNLIPELKAAVRDRDLPPAGRLVKVFGYPRFPSRPEGCWVEAEIVGLVGDRRLQIDALQDSAVRIQPGFSGGPVVDRQTGLVLGLVATAPEPESGARDGHAVTVDRIGAMWPGPPTPPAARPPLPLPLMTVGERRTTPVRDGIGQPGGPATRDDHPTEAERIRTEGLVVLHLSDLRFGAGRVFGDRGPHLPGPDQDAFFTGLTDDLDKLAKNESLHPDLVIVTGDLTASGLAPDFADVSDFLARLAAELNLPRRRVAVIPGDHDVDRLGSRMAFLGSRRKSRIPEPPFRPTWDEYAAAFDTFYQRRAGYVFDAAQPWTLFEIPELRLLVAGLNSTMAESHHDEDRYGEIGRPQLEWFRDRLTAPRYGDWIRIGAVHHHIVHGETEAEEQLRDARALDHHLGRPRLLHLLLHGHGHGHDHDTGSGTRTDTDTGTGTGTALTQSPAARGGPHRLPSGLLTLSTGSTTPGARRGAHDDHQPEPSNRYQILRLRRGEIDCYLRRHQDRGNRWVGDDDWAGADHAATAAGHGWRRVVDWTFPDIGQVFPHPETWHAPVANPHQVPDDVRSPVG